MAKSISKTIRRLIMCVVAFFAAAKTTADDTFVIVNKSTVERVSYSDVEDVFTLRTKRWVNGVPVKVFLLPRDNPRTKEFAMKYLGMSANRYYDLVEGRESSGRGNIAQVVDTEVKMVIKIMTTPGSIGYASESIVVNVDGDLIIIK